MPYNDDVSLWQIISGMFIHSKGTKLVSVYLSHLYTYMEMQLY